MYFGYKLPGKLNIKMILIVCLLSGLLTFSVHTIEQLSVRCTYSEENTIENNLELLFPLNDPWQWKNASVEEKKGIIEKVSQIQGKDLGLSKKQKLIFEEIENSGRYYPGKQTICLSNKLLHEDPEQILTVLFEEIFHAAQYQYVKNYEWIGEPDLCFFESAAILKEEMESYSKFMNGGGSHFDMMMEMQAWEYSVVSVDRFFKDLNSCLLHAGMINKKFDDKKTVPVYIDSLCSMKIQERKEQ